MCVKWYTKRLEFSVILHPKIKAVFRFKYPGQFNVKIIPWKCFFTFRVIAVQKSLRTKAQGAFYMFAHLVRLWSTFICNGSSQTSRTSDWCYELKETVIVSVPVYSQLTDWWGHRRPWETLSVWLDVTGCWMEQMNQICQPVAELQSWFVINHVLYAKWSGARLLQISCLNSHNQHCLHTTQISVSK